MNQSLDTYRGPIRVTVCYILLYYVFIIIQVVLKFYTYFREKGKDAKVRLSDIKYNSLDPLVLTGNRTVGNALEQAIPFLVSLWLHSIFVDVEYATFIGGIYVLTRSYYPLVFRSGGIMVFLSTFPNYACIGLLLWPVIKLVF